jgi:hypothetical protein
METSKFDGMAMQEVGYQPKSEEEYKSAPVGSEERPKMVYPSIWTDGKEMPIDLTGYKAGDKVYFCAEANISEITTRDRDGVTEKEAPRYQFELLRIGIKPMEKQEEKKEAPEEQYIDADKEMAELTTPDETRFPL